MTECMPRYADESFGEVCYPGLWIADPLGIVEINLTKWDGGGSELEGRGQVAGQKAGYAEITDYT